MIVLVLLSRFASPQDAEKGKQLKNADSQEDRRKQLIESLNRGELSAVRATEELALMGKPDAATRQAILAAVLGPRGKLKYLSSDRLWNALATAGPEAVPGVLDNLKKIDPSTLEYGTLVELLGRLGPSAKQAIPLLREKLTDRRISTANRIVTRVALANVGDSSQEIVKAIAQDLKKGSPTWDHVVSAMNSVQPRDWVNDAVLEGLLKHFESRGKSPRAYDNVYPGAITLGLLGEKAASSARVLENAQKITLDSGKEIGLIFSLALARVAPDKQDGTLRRLFKAPPKVVRELDNTSIALLMSIPYQLMDARLSKHLARMLDDADPKVAEGAAIVLWWAGLSAKEAYPQVLKIVQGKGEKRRRALAAWVLGRIATFEQLPELEAALKAEKANEVQKEIKTAITDIRFLRWEYPFEEDARSPNWDFSLQSIPARLRTGK